ncbi:MAG: hypothetical protein ABL888_00655 [Pirellulaceae bacterium]
MTVASSSPDHILITIHGIRTYGQWQSRLADLVRQAKPDIQSKEYHYGVFSAVQLWIPPIRWIVAWRFRRWLNTLLRNEAHPIQVGTRIDIVAHSFGTYVVARALTDWRGRPIRNLTERIDTIVLAASVLKASFQAWTSISRRLINECGTRDNVLVLNQLVNLGLGLAGRHGFQGAQQPDKYLNRYFSYTHSEYFGTEGAADADDFMLREWVPVLTTHNSVRRQLLVTPPSPLFDRVLANSKPLTIFVYCLALFLLARYVSIAAWTQHYRNVRVVAQRGVTEMEAGRLLEAVPYLSAAVEEEQAFTPLVWFAKNILRRGNEEVSHRLRLIACIDQCPLIACMAQVDVSGPHALKNVNLIFAENDKQLLLLKNGVIESFKVDEAGGISGPHAFAAVNGTVDSLSVDSTNSDFVSVALRESSMMKLVRLNIRDGSIVCKLEISPPFPRVRYQWNADARRCVLLSSTTPDAQSKSSSSEIIVAKLSETQGSMERHPLPRNTISVFISNDERYVAIVTDNYGFNAPLPPMNDDVPSCAGFRIQLKKGDFSKDIGPPIDAWMPHATFSPDDSFLFTIGPWGQVWKHNLATIEASDDKKPPKPVVLLLPNSAPTWMNFGESGRLYVAGTQVGGSDGAISGLAVAVDNRLSIRRHGKSVTEILSAKAASQLLVKGDEGILSRRLSLGVYTAGLSRALTPPIGGLEEIVATNISNSGRFIATLSSDGLLIIWDVGSRLPALSDVSPELAIDSIVSDDGKFLAMKDTPYSPWVVYGHDANGLRKVQPLTAKPDDERPSSDPIFVPGGKLIAAPEYITDKKGIVREQWRLYNTSSVGSGLVLNVAEEGCERPSFSQDGRWVLAANQTMLELTNLDSKNGIHLQWKVEPPEAPSTRRVVLSRLGPGTKRVAAGVSTNDLSLSPLAQTILTEVRVWKVGSPNSPPMILPLADVKEMSEILFTSDEGRLIVGADSSITIFDLTKPGSPPLFLDHGEQVLRAELSHDERHLLTDGETTVRMWILSSGVQLIAAPHENQPNPLSTIVDATHTLIVRNPFSEQLWDIATGWPITPSPEYCYRSPTSFRLSTDAIQPRFHTGVNRAVWHLDASDRTSEQARRIARVVSGVEVDSDGNLRFLSAEERTAAWQSLRNTTTGTSTAN